MSQDGAYAVVNEYGEKVVFMFEEKDDAYRYAEQLEAQGDPEMVVISLKDNVAIAACERTGTRYTICLLYTSPSPRDKRQARMPSSA